MPFEDAYSIEEDCAKAPPYSHLADRFPCYYATAEGKEIDRSREKERQREAEGEKETLVPSRIAPTSVLKLEAGKVDNDYNA